MLNAFVIVWRESLEAMLVIGVLLSWIARQPEPAPLRRGLWLGVGVGVALAVALGFATFAAQTQFEAEALERFQLGMVLVAAALILQMVLWMHRHGRAMRRELEAQAARKSGAFGIAAITALAVAREGAETVVFLYGVSMEGAGSAVADMVGVLGAVASGFLAAFLTAWLVARGARFLSMRTLFLTSEILLLLIANALLANGVDRMIALEWLPPLVDPVWDMSTWLADGQGAGRFLADFAGYRARPAGVLLLAMAVFWGYVLWSMRRVDSASTA